MKIVNSTFNDIDTIFDLYDEAAQYQIKVFKQQWVGFERSLVETELQENRQWKIIIDGKIACIFAVTFNDAVFWGERDKQPSIYIHRIVTKAAFRGNSFVKIIIEWAKTYCKKHQKQFVRLDTLADNQKLVDYYVQCGFKHIDTVALGNITDVPAHYKGNLALFEIAV